MRGRQNRGGKGKEDIVRVRNNLFSLCLDGWRAPLHPKSKHRKDELIFTGIEKILQLSFTKRFYIHTSKPNPPIT